MPDTVDPAPGGGWISGPCTDGAAEHPPHDRRSGYSPAALVLDVQRLLRQRGLQVEVDQGMTFVAGIAAADLLRALGVRPETAPQRRA